jgi:uncharacterized membrane protein
MSARALALGGILGLLLLQWRWHAMIAPPSSVAPSMLVTIYCLPMLPCLILLALRHRAAMLVGAIAALLYFCHGVMFAFGEPALRAPALTEVALSVIVVVAASWNGLRARFARKSAV